MNAKTLFATSSLLIILSALSGCKDGASAGGARGPAPVSVVPVVSRSFTDSEKFSGRLEATEYVELRPRVSGTIDKIHFTDGAIVAKDQPLVTIDQRPFAAEVARLEAQWTAAKSRSDLANIEFARAQKLSEAGGISKQEFDQIKSTANTSASDVLAAEAALRTAKLNLEFSSVRAPIAGRVSRATVTAGNLVNEQVVLTTIAGITRVYAYFDCNEQVFLSMRAAGDKTPSVRMGLANEEGYPHSGKLDFVDNRLNPQTGAIRMRATFDNAKGQFLPGLAVHILMNTTDSREAVMVPERAIGTDQTRKFVVVIGENGQPEFRPVQLGPLDGEMRVIAGGPLKAGEHIVVDGLQRIIPGVPVTADVLKVDERGMPLPKAQPTAEPKKN